MADVLPIGVPSRSELWRRQQLARSLLGHRDVTPENAALIRRVLDGEQIDELMKRSR